MYNSYSIISAMYYYMHVYLCSHYNDYTNGNFLVALVITNGPMNVTVCSGTNAEISCGFTGVPYPSTTIPNWYWRIIKRNNDGYVISNETVNARDINANITDSLIFYFVISNRNGFISAENSYLSVGPVDDTYNNTSYQCIFTINDTIIESDTAGTITVIGKHILLKCSTIICYYMQTLP